MSRFLNVQVVIYILYLIVGWGVPSLVAKYFSLSYLACVGWTQIALIGGIAAVAFFNVLRCLNKTMEDLDG